MTTAAPTSDAAEQQQHDDVHGLEPGDDEHRGRAHHDHEHRAEVVLGVDDRHDEPGETDRHRDTPRVEITAVLMAVAAIATTSTTLAISDGWNWNGPTWNHACAPPWLRPSTTTPASNGRIAR